MALSTTIHSYLQALLKDASRQAFLQYDTAEILDFTTLFETLTEDASAASTWISQILQGNSFEMTLPEAGSEEQLKRLYQKGQQLEAREGAHPLALGFPMLCASAHTLGEGVLCAPLFRFPVRLLPQEKGWVLAYDAAQAGALNEVLDAYLEQVEGINLYELWRSYDEKMPFEARLNRFVQTLLETLPSTQTIEPWPQDLASIPAVDTLTAEPPTTWTIHWSAHLARYALSTLPAEDAPAPEAPTMQAPLKSWYHRISLLPLAPAQMQAFNALAREGGAAVYGGDQTGKTYVSVAALSAPLASGRTALHVVNSTARHRKLRAQIQEADLDHLVLDLADAHATQAMIWNALQAAFAQQKGKVSNDETHYEQALLKYKYTFDQLEEVQTLLQKVHWGKQNWTSLVADFMHYHQQAPKQLLDAYLEVHELEWSEEAWTSYKTALIAHEKLYKAIPQALPHPLKSLPRTFFLKESNTLGCKEIRSFVEARLEEAQNLYQDYLTFIEAYKDKQRVRHQEVIKGWRQKAALLRREVRLAKKQYGADIENWGALTSARLNVMGMFSKKHRNVLLFKEHLREEYEALAASYKKQPYFEFEFPSLKSVSAKQIEEQLIAFSAAAEAWVKASAQRIDQQVQKIRPNGQGMHQADQSELRRLEAHWEVIEEECKAIAFNWRKPIGSLKDRREQLGDWYELILSMHSRLGELEAYYVWRKDWETLPQGLQSVVKALERVHSSNWQAAFRSWYLFHALEHLYKLHLPSERLPLQEHLEYAEKLRKHLKEKITASTTLQRQEAFKTLKQEDRNLWNALKSKKPLSTANEDLATFLLVHKKLLQAVFPITIARATQAQEALTHLGTSYGLLVLHDADTLAPKTWLDLQKLAQRQLLLASSNCFDSATYNPVAFEGRLLDTSNSAPVPNRFGIELQRALQTYISLDRLTPNITLEGIQVDLRIKSASAKKPDVLVVVDGLLQQVAAYGFEAAEHTAHRLAQKGYIVYDFWSSSYWLAPRQNIEKLIAYILQEDQAN